MSERKKIDQLFQEKFQDFEVNPPEMVWTNIEEKLKEHSDCNAQYTIEQYFCKSHNYEIHEYFVKKMSEQKTDYQKMEMTRRFIDESRCLSRPMNIVVFLKLREMEIDDFNKDLIT